jgi:hypothetical protein
VEPEIDDDKRLNEEKRLRIRNNRHFFLLLLVFLVALVLADGAVTRFLVNNGLGSEANPFLKMWVKSDLLFVIKLVGASLAACILILKLVGPKDCETVNATGELYTPEAEAVILVVPAVNPVAEPLEPMFAIPELLLFQDTMELIFADEPSE